MIIFLKLLLIRIKLELFSLFMSIDTRVNHEYHYCVLKFYQGDEVLAKLYNPDLKTIIRKKIVIDLPWR